LNVEGRPIPVIDSDSKIFWENCQNNILVLPKCQDCGDYFFYPRSICPNCMSDQIEWKEVSGNGKVYSYTIARRPAGKAFAAYTPYIVAIIQLDEGPRMMANIINVELSEISCEMRVQVVYQEINDSFKLPMFEPVTS
jgi:uncharacterized OB-fold protein